MAIDNFPLWHASLRHPAGNIPLYEGEPCITMYKSVFLHIGIFFSSGRGSFLVLSAPGHTGSPPEHHGASVGPSGGSWHVFWGFKSRK